MSYRELKEFMQGMFQEKARDVLDKCMRETGVTDIDGVSDKQKMEFAQYVLKEHIILTPQQNRQAFERLLSIIGLKGMRNAAEYRKITRELNKQEQDILLASFDAFSAQIEKAYSKFEIMINVFWQKGIEAEKEGKSKQVVEGIVKKAVSDIRHDMHEAYTIMLDDLYLDQFVKKSHFKAEKIFENVIDLDTTAKPDIQSQRMLRSVSFLMAEADKAILTLEKLTLESIRALSAQNKEADAAYVEGMKKRIYSIWDEIKAKKEKEHAALKMLAAEPIP